MINPTSTMVRLIFADIDPSTSNPAAVGALARVAVSGLRDTGEILIRDQRDAGGAAEAFAWLINAAIVDGPFIGLADLSLKLAQLLSEIRKLRGKNQAASPFLPITVVVQVGSTGATLGADAALNVDALLDRLLVAGLPEQILPANTTIIVQLPPGSPPLLAN